MKAVTGNELAAVMPAISRGPIGATMARSLRSACVFIDAMLFGGAECYQPKKLRYLSPGSCYLAHFFCYPAPFLCYLQPRLPIQPRF